MLWRISFVYKLSATLWSSWALFWWEWWGIMWWVRFKHYFQGPNCEIFSREDNLEQTQYPVLGVCGGYLNTTSGVLTSPSYPGEYPENAECVYSISQPNDTYVTITILSFNLHDEYPYACGSASGYDYIEIRDGSSKDSPLMEKFCGRNIPASLQSTQNKMWIR